jgi:surfactin synthase thioesterase subunit
VSGASRDSADPAAATALGVPAAAVDPAAPACLPWFHPLREGTGHRLVFFPCAGESASSGWVLDGAVPADWSVWSVQYPARGPRLRELLPGSIRELAEGCLPALLPIPDRIVLFGHSFGAYVAYDTARLLAERGHDVAGLVVSGTAAPGSVVREASSDDLDDATLRDFLARQGVATAEVLADEELMEMVLPALRTDRILARTYIDDHEGRCAIPTLAVGGRADPLVSQRDLQSWSSLTDVWLGDELIDGDHFYFIRRPDSFADALNRHWPAEAVAQAESVM